MRKYPLEMDSLEIRPVTLKVLDLQTGETVTGATVTHIPPEGQTQISITPDYGTNPYVKMLFGPFAEKGMHKVHVLAEGSNGSKPVVLYFITVEQNI